MRAKDEVNTGGGPLLLARLAIAALVDTRLGLDGLPDSVHVEEVGEEVAAQRARARGENTVGGAVVVDVDAAETTNEDSELRGGKSEQLSAINDPVLQTVNSSAAGVVAEAVGDGLEVVVGLDIGLLLGGVHAAGSEGDVNVDTSTLGSLLNTGSTGEDDKIGNRDALAVALRVVEFLLDTLELAEDLGELRGVVDLPVLHGSETDARAVGTTALVAATESRGRGPGSGDELGGAKASVKNGLLERGGIIVVDDGVVERRDGVLPEEVLRRNFRAEVESLGAEIAVQQLEPSTGKGISELVGVLEEAARDLLVGRVDTERQISRQHSGEMLLVGVKGIRNEWLSVLGNPLRSASGALGELPLVLEEVLEVLVAPLGRGLGPNNLETRCNGIGALARVVAVLPSEALSLNASASRLGTNVAVRSSAVGLAKGVTTGDESDSLLVVHGHAAEGGADVVGGGNGVFDTRVDVDETCALLVRFLLSRPGLL